MKAISCHKSRYSVYKRDHSQVRFIVIHFTAVDGDTAESEGRAFSRPGASTSAHFFIDRAGNVVKSVPINRTAWSVGGAKYNDYKTTGGASYYGRCTNSTSVSIELCDLYTKHSYPSAQQVKALCDTIKYIRKYCKNANTVIRHFDVTGKYCPRTMCKPYGSDARWQKLRAKIKKDCGI